MKNLFIITEEEKKRILGLHENATKRQYLSEQQKLFRKSADDGQTWVVDSFGKRIRLAKDDDFDLPIYGQTIISTTTTTTAAPVKKERVIPTTESQLSKGQGYLKYGDKNSLVSIIQDMLIFVGEKITKTGVYDRATYDAVKKFQTENKSITNQALKPDGLLGKNTYLSLKQKYDNLKRIEFKAPSIADTDTGDDVVVPDNNAASKTTTNQQTTSTDQARIDAAKNYVNYKDEYPETPPQ